jgi:hypothetical protein
MSTNRRFTVRASIRRAWCAAALLVCLAVCPSQAQHWAFSPPIRPAVPAVSQAGRVRNPVDAFIVRGLEARGLSPSPPADSVTLLRRVTVDLTGLPPTPGEIAKFLADRSPHAYETVVERLLRSPHFGERWAQHWLDVVRFAESNGYEHDADRVQAWRYRDWVVGAFNSDKPYDRFIREQVAGDLLAPNDFDACVATGFLRAGPMHITGGNLDPTEMRQEWLTEAVSGIGNAVLGLTIGCARCHNHKYDPIPQADYYRLQACFAATANNDETRATDAEKRKFTEASSAIDERVKPIEAQIAVIEKPYRERLREQKRLGLAPEYRAALAIDPARRSAQAKKLAGEAGTQLAISWDEVVNALSPADREKRSALRQRMFAIQRELPSPLPEAEGVGDVLRPPEAARILIRGDVHNPGPVVTPGFPTCLSRENAPSAPSGNPRLALANWLTDPDNALTSRVFVNRVWHYLFGRGLVATPNDFGTHGEAPSNPAVLDWLATTFTAGSPSAPSAGRNALYSCGWSMKSLIRLIVTSSTYRQACAFDKAAAAVDPDNRLLWRMNRKRMDAEALRDSILAVAGTLNLETSGPSVRVPLEPEVYATIFTESEPDNLWPPTPDVRQHTRRSLYLFRKRNVRLPMLAVFDQPDMMSSCAARGQTVHALQALTLVNSNFMRAQSFALARRLCREMPAGKPTGLHPAHHFGSGNVERNATSAARKKAPSSSAARGGESKAAIRPRGSAAGPRVARLFLLALGRPARPDELRATERFLADQTALLRRRAAKGELPAVDGGAPAGEDAAAFTALADLCLATLNLNEFVNVR